MSGEPNVWGRPDVPSRSEVTWQKSGEPAYRYRGGVEHMSLPDLPVQPDVTVFATVLNEERHLEAAVASVWNQDYEGALSMVVAVGPSEDDTAEIAARLAQEDSRLTVTENPTGRTPEGLNAALALAASPVVVRMDGHTELPADYVSRAVHSLRETGAANVGGRMDPVGDGPLTWAIAWAMSSRWGIGGAKFHVGGKPGPTDSVFLGNFRADALRDVGGFDAHFSRAQDWELNYRLRQRGYMVWFDPAMEVTYRPRASMRALARQFFSSGRWRREVVSRHPSTASVRYLLPPAVAAASAVALVAGTTGALYGEGALLWSFAIPGAYVLGLLGVSVTALSRVGTRAGMWLPAVLATMHMSWGLGFLRGLR